MTLAFTVVRLCFVFENKNLHTLAMLNNLSSNFSAIYHWLTNGNFALVYYSQNLVKNNILASFDF